MAAPRKPKRRVVVDKRTSEAMRNKAKEAKMDEASELPIPDDGLDHAAWPAEARKLALLLIDPTWAGATQQELADECGYSLRSVQRHMNDAKFKTYVNALAGKAYDDLFPLFVAAMKSGLREGNAKFVEMFMKSRGMLKEVRQVTSEGVVTHKVEAGDNDGEIERLRKELGLDAGDEKGVVN